MKIGDRVNRVSDELLAAAARVDSASIGHFAEFGFVDPDIRALWPSPKVIGKAFTIRTPAMDSTMVHRAIELVGAGDIVLIDRSLNRTHAAVGGGIAYAAQARGALAIVVDGVATDLQEITAYQLPVYARGVSNLTTKVLGLGGDINVPIAVGGVVVTPGDLVVCDCNGVMVLEPGDAWELIPLAEQAEARWPGTKQRIDEGTALTNISGSKQVIAANIPALIRDLRSGKRSL